MDWNLVLCFIWINFVSIQALRTFKNVDTNMLMKYLHRQSYENPLTNAVYPEYSPNIHYDFGRNILVKHRKPIYAIVVKDIVRGEKYSPLKGLQPNYLGNGKWNYLKKKENPTFLRRHRSGLNKKLSSAKRAFNSSEEVNDKAHETNIFQDNKNLKNNDLASSGHFEVTEKPQFGNHDLFENLSDDLHEKLMSNHNKKIKPGSSLLQLKYNDLASAGQFPVTEKSSLVYGNLENLGITYGKTKQRLAYSNFRRTNNVRDLFDIIIPKSRSGPKKWIVLEITPKKIQKYLQEMSNLKTKEKSEENSASEILDEFDNDLESRDAYRRSKPKSKFRKRDKYVDDSKDLDESSNTSDSSSDSASSNEKNPGNPYTLYKGKYKQNWMFNHFMDGDHMNINPYGPLFHEMSAQGRDLFFGRKWWYFNQDDYKPMG